MDYVVILEKGKKSFGAYVPDLPGCVAVGKTKREGRPRRPPPRRIWVSRRTRR